MEEYQNIKFNCNAKSGKTHSSPLNMNNRLKEKQKQLEEIFKQTGEEFIKFERNEYGQLCVVYKDCLFENAPEKCVRIDSVLKNRKNNGYKNNQIKYINQVQQHANQIGVKIIKYLYNNKNQKCIIYKCLHQNSKEKMITVQDFLKKQDCGCNNIILSKKKTLYKSKILNKAKELNLQIINISYTQPIIITYKCLTHQYSFEKQIQYNSFISKQTCGCNNIEINYEKILQHGKEINCDIIKIENNQIVFKCNKHNDCREQKCSYQIFMKRKTCGCKEFIKENASIKNIRYTKEIIQKQAEKIGVQVIEIFQDRKYDGTSERKLKYICLRHNDKRIKTCAVKDFMKKEQCGCMGQRGSKGERIIQSFLLKNNIQVETQKQFENCKYVLSLKFDFYLPDYNMCIEYNGKQHYNWSDTYFSNKITEEQRKEKFKEQQTRDEIKRQYCMDNGIKLLEIPCWDIRKIPEILQRELKL